MKRRTSLRAFLFEICGAPHPRVRRPLKLADVVEKALDFQRRNGHWPTAASTDPELSKIGETWHRYDRALRTGNRGLPRTALLELFENYGQKRACRRRRGS